MKHRADIDGLRTLAVVPVVLFHAGFNVPGGFVGVDVFFVISGFLITAIIRREMETGRFSILDFYARRARRLFPALFAMMAVVLVWTSLTALPQDAAAVAKSAAAATLFASNILFWLDVGYFNETALTKPLLHTWSLAVEEQFYILLPPLLLALTAWRRRLIAPALGLIAAASFAASVALSARHPDAAYYLLPTRAWELLIGALAAAAVADPRAARMPRWLAEGMGAAGLAAILGAAMLYSEATVFPGWTAAVPCLGAAALLVSGAARTTGAARLLALRPMVWVGLISYSLYLWHWPVIVWANYGRMDPLSGAEAAGAVAIAGLLAVLSWRFVERPFRAGRLATGRRAALTFAGGVMATGLAASLFVVAAGGFPGRLPGDLARLDPSSLMHDRRDCHGVDAARLLAGRACVLGAPGAAPSFVLAGDSHADAISPAIFASAETLGLAGWQVTRAGVAMLPGLRRLGGGAPAPLIDAFDAFLGARDAVTTVVLSAYWLRYAAGETYRHAPAIWVDEGYDGSGRAYGPRALTGALTRLVQAHPGKRFVLLDDVPSGWGLHLKSYARWRLGRPGAQPTAYGLPRAEADRQRAAYEPLFASLAEDLPNLSYWPVMARVCGAARCPLFDDAGRALFRDGDHLSAGGALRLAPAIGAMLKAEARAAEVAMR